jgi:hypothetical protein
LQLRFLLDMNWEWVYPLGDLRRKGAIRGVQGGKQW